MIVNFGCGANPAPSDSGYVNIDGSLTVLLLLLSKFDYMGRRYRGALQQVERRIEVRLTHYFLGVLTENPYDAPALRDFCWSASVINRFPCSKFALRLSVHS